MGLPIKRLVIATNENDILHRCIEEGEYYKLGVSTTISPSMDIEVSSNFERALFLAYGKDGGEVSRLMAELATTGRFRLSNAAMDNLSSIYASGRADEARTYETITLTMAETGEVLCPHSAVGVAVGQWQLRRDPSVPMISLATAHPAKFPDAVERATGIRPPLPARMADLFDRKERVTRMPNDLKSLQSLVRERIAR
jgi:threonine synthase